jgi:methyl-accepting chemotaxis protein/methyl-accepting chemotaxis protein-1 (serine sensor receptor)
MSEMTIGQKLMLGFTTMLLVALALGGGYLYSVRSLAGALQTATNLTARKIFLASSLEGQLFRLRSCQRGVMLFSIEKLPAQAQSNKAEFETRVGDAEAISRELDPLLLLPKARTDIASIETELNSLKGYFEQVATAATAGDSKTATKINQEQSIGTFDALDTAAEDLVEIEKSLMKASSEEGARDSSRAYWMAYLFLVVAVGLSPFVLLLIARTTRQLREVAAHLADGAEQITSASSQVASSSQTLAQGASEQAGALEETSSSSEEITSMTRKNAENSQAAAALMVEVDRHVMEGNRTLEEMVHSMREITGSSDKISKIIKVIDEIAFQTNILALNAAVEAARAGEAGMGFAVVADEVRSLAQRSAQAADDTAGLIVESMAKSNEGSERLEHVAQVIRAITESAAQVKTLVDEVNLGSQEQARGIEHISKSIAEMDRVTQSNAASAEQSASASQEMSAQAEALQNIANELRTLVGGGDHNAGAKRPAARTPRVVAASPRNLLKTNLGKANRGKTNLGKTNLGKTKDFAALHKSNPVTPRAGSHAIPLDEDFVDF